MRYELEEETLPILIEFSALCREMGITLEEGLEILIAILCCFVKDSNHSSAFLDEHLGYQKATLARRIIILLGHTAILNIIYSNHDRRK